MPLKPAGFRFPGWLVGIPFAFLFVLFAVSNRAEMPLTLWPLPGSLDVPIYEIVLAALLLGFVIGVGAAFLSRLGRRR